MDPRHFSRPCPVWALKPRDGDLMRSILVVVLVPSLCFAGCTQGRSRSPWIRWGKRPQSHSEPTPTAPESKPLALLVEVGVGGHLQFEDRNIEINGIPEIVRERHPETVYVHVGRGPYMAKAAEARDAFRAAGVPNVI